MFLNESHSATIIPTLDLKRPARRHFNLYDRLHTRLTLAKEALNKYILLHSASCWVQACCCSEARVFIFSQPLGSEARDPGILTRGGVYSWPECTSCSTHAARRQLHLSTSSSASVAKKRSACPERNHRHLHLHKTLNPIKSCPFFPVGTCQTRRRMLSLKLLFSMCQSVMENKPSGPRLRAWIWLNNRRLCSVGSMVVQSHGEGGVV